MGTLECARQVQALSISEADKATILGGEALKLLGGAKDENRKRQARA
jgi:hypothetical protein